MKLGIISKMMFLLFLLPFSVQAKDPVFTTLFSDKAIRGYDTVAYFTENKPVKGDEDIAHQYKGAVWLFSTEENKKMFVENPEKYAPQYGGYCAWAVAAKNNTASTQPELFTIHDDKLYLNYSTKINKKWLVDKEGFIKKANRNWPGVLK